jgi:hypothetical protein
MGSCLAVLIRWPGRPEVDIRPHRLAAWQKPPLFVATPPSSRFRGGTLTGGPTWPCALIGDSFPAVAMSFITKGAATEMLRVSSSTPVELGVWWRN